MADTSIPNGTAATSTASSLASRAAALAGSVGPDLPESLGRSIDRLKEEQARLRADRKRVAKELRNASKRKTRLRKRARQLSNDDLLAVLVMRQNTEEDQADPADAAGDVAAAENSD